MKKAILLAAVALMAIGARTPAATAQTTGEATVTLALSSNNPHIGDTVTVTITVTNVDSVAHTFGTRGSISAAPSSSACHQAASFFSGLQLATYQPSESHVYQTTFIATTPNCPPNDHWLILASAQDTALTGFSIVGTDSQGVFVQ